MAVEVREVEEADVEVVLMLLGQLSDSPAEACSPVDVRRTWQKIRRQHGRTLLVATVDGTPAGTADVTIVPNFTHGCRPWAIVENVVVDRRQRRRGVGRALLADIIRRAHDNGCYKVQLLSNRRRTEAHVFYRSLGFETTAEGFRLYL